MTDLTSQHNGPLYDASMVGPHRFPGLDPCRGSLPTCHAFPLLPFGPGEVDVPLERVKGIEPS